MNKICVHKFGIDNRIYNFNSITRANKELNIKLKNIPGMPFKIWSFARHGSEWYKAHLQDRKCPSGWVIE